MRYSVQTMINDSYISGVYVDGYEYDLEKRCVILLEKVAGLELSKGFIHQVDKVEEKKHTTGIVQVLVYIKLEEAL